MTGGREQVTERGDPLYRFSGDAAPGDARGQGISSFGGVWRVVVVSKARSKSSAKPSTNGRGYGY
jgi:hypothetical protein